MPRPLPARTAELTAALEAKGREVEALDDAIAAISGRVPASLTDLHARTVAEHDHISAAITRAKA